MGFTFNGKSNKDEGEVTYRICGDFCHLNMQTFSDCYPLPNLFGSTARLFGKKFFSAVNLVRVYYNITVFPGDIEKTIVISPAGLYEYLRMPFGLKNAPATFQRFMNLMLSDLSVVYNTDDILIFKNI